MEKIKVKNNGAADKSTVEKLWKDYQAAKNANRPEKQLEILSEIKKTASDLRMPWDFYQAGKQYVDVALSRNWKLRDSLNTAFKKEVAEFDEPVMTYYDTRFIGSDKMELVTSRRSELEQGRHPEFWENDGNITGKTFGPALLKFTENDYQYVLWSMGEKELLAEALGDKYPCAQFLEYYKLLSLDEFRRKEYLEEYIKKYDGKAVAFLASEELLQMEFLKLERDEAGSDEFKALRSRCTAFEKARSKFTGDEKIIAGCCTRVSSLIETLDSKGLSFEIDNGILELTLRNLDGADLAIKEGKSTILSTRLDNPAGSYFVYDTVKFVLPELNDGEYTVSCKNGKEMQEIEYQKYSLSMSLRHDASGYAVFVADALTGEPVGKADFTLHKEDKEVDALKDVSLNGYTRLPDSFFSRAENEKWKYSLECRFTGADGLVRKTRLCGFSESHTRNGRVQDRTYAQVLVDRSAFNPDDTVRFKAVLYHGDPQYGFKTCEPDFKLQAKLFNAENELLETLDLTTNGYGSAAGSFVLKRSKRNGSYRIAISDGETVLAQRYVTVDDFVLPTFELSFDPDDRLYFPGDEITVSGRISSFSGHSLSSADVHCTVTSGGKTILEKVLKPEADGSFSISFPSGDKEWQSFDIEVRVTDTTGETLEWSTSRDVISQIPFSAEMLNCADADLTLSEKHNYIPDEEYDCVTASGDIFIIKLHNRQWRTAELDRESLRINYTLSLNGRTVADGSARPGDELRLDTSAQPSGLYTFSARATDTDVYGNKHEATATIDILKVNDNDTALFCDIKNLYKTIDDGNGNIGLLIGSTEGPVWACVDLYGSDNRLLGSRLVHLSGKKGEPGSLENVSFKWQEGWSDIVRISVLYFKEYKQYTFQHDFDRSAERLALPLAFSRFVDRTSPRSTVSLEIATAPGVECTATVFDKSTESIAANIWRKVTLQSLERPTVSTSIVTGCNGMENYRPLYRNMAMTKGAAAVTMDYVESVYEESYEMADEGLYDENPEEATIRENFANTLAFEPFLRSDDDGLIRFDITAADKLSTYYVQLFAHDKDMNNAALRREMMVTIPVKVAVTEPQFLYAGDLYNVKASLSSNASESILGTLRVDFYDSAEYKGKTPFKSLSKKVEVGAMSSLAEEFPVEAASMENLGLLVSFIADDRTLGSDAIFVSIPVMPAEQTITEAHSSVLHSGESKDALIAALRGQFVNGSGDDAEVTEISILDMVKDAIPTKVEPVSDNALDLSEALLVRLLAERLGSSVRESVKTSDEEILSKLMSCRKSDGGFAWFREMESSPIITAALLQRLAALRDRGIDVSDAISRETVSDAVKYLDNSYFADKKLPFWRGGLSLEQYAATRAMFADVAFSVDSKKTASFRKDIKEFLTPSKERGMNGYILGIAQRMQILMYLSESEEGLGLSKAWGIKLGTKKKLQSSLSADLASLSEYAIEHKCGGWYYPNAVMPFRGLLESEAYAHSFIAETLSKCNSGLAEGIRLWLMIQKETQHWDEDAAFVEALATILDASEATLNTKIITLRKTVRLPFEQIKASGNGMTVECHYLLDGKEIEDGQALKVGDKIRAEYRIWNEENRSFVRLAAFRPASLRPVDQLSGAYYGSFYGSYRNVLGHCTEYWFESWPEETTTVKEEFFVTQSGTFQSPAIEIESLYAPHYRANSSSRKNIKVK